MMIVFIIIVLVLVIALAAAQAYMLSLLKKLCELAEEPREETPKEKERERYEKQWNALMTYRGDTNGETKANSDE